MKVVLLVLYLCMIVGFNSNLVAQSDTSLNDCYLDVLHLWRNDSLGTDGSRKIIAPIIVRSKDLFINKTEEFLKKQFGTPITITSINENFPNIEVLQYWVTRKFQSDYGYDTVIRQLYVYVDKDTREVLHITYSFW